ncbi:response regulator [Pontibacterium sp. N1Y112]|uniref:Response regulator n=1 Tax=Pontibacterium sinense TaxID=2781979 RepID=A0A8J7FHH2_9GAMM|nr:HD domain-containing phosphohydrolase [Pontibacterium sinense]MBE9396163.1 response regulator [Pontibacterium sinense]
MEQLAETAPSDSAGFVANQKIKILCVDDEASVLSSLKRVLRGASYQFFSASCARDGLFILKNQPVDIVISDMRMPEVNGAEFLSDVASQYPNCVRILLTGYSDIESTIQAVNEGQIHRYMRKPWNNEDLILTVSQAVERARLQSENTRLLSQVEKQNQLLMNMNAGLENKVQQRTKQIRLAMGKLHKANLQANDNLKSTIRVFYNLISLNPHLGGRIAVEVGELCKLLATRMNLTKREIRAIHLSGLLYELGLLGSDDELLNKPVYELSPDELNRYRKHPAQAYIALAPATGLQDVATIIKYQYEAYDGTGLPDRLSGTDIPVGARILAIARDYILSVHGRLRKGRSSVDGALRRLEMNADREYDSCIVMKLGDVLPCLQQDVLGQDEWVVSIKQLRVGMQLSRNLFNDNDILLLPEGHRFTNETVRRLQSFEQTDQQLLEIYVFNNE